MRAVEYWGPIFKYFFLLQSAGCVLFLLGKSFIQVQSQDISEHGHTFLNNSIIQFPVTSPPNVVLYNRVGKSGSTSMINLLGSLCNHRQSNCTLDNIGIKHRKFWEKTATASKQVVNYIVALSKRKGVGDQYKLVVVFHGAYIEWNENFSTDFDKVIYVNVVREPISRMRSLFFYEQAKGGYKKGIQRCARLAGLKEKPANGMLVDPVDCAKNRKCAEFLMTGSYGGVLSFLPALGDKSYWTRDDMREKRIHTAIDVIMQKYLLVIPLEAMDHGLALMECILPTYFSGALNKWKKQAMGNYHSYQQNHSPPLTEEGRQILNKIVHRTGEDLIYQATVERFCSIIKYVQQNEICPNSFLHELPKLCM